VKLFNIFGKTEKKDLNFDAVLRLLATQMGMFGSITPDNCMRSPTVHAIITAVTRRMASTPIHVYQSSVKNGREVKEKLPNHPVAQLLRQPNEWQSKFDYWQDAVSTFIRHGRYIAKIGRGATGPIRRLYPVNPSSVEIKQDPTSLAVTFRRSTEEWTFDKVHFVRGPSRDFFSGDSPVKDVSTTIALEIAAEEFGASFFNNGAVPLMVLRHVQGSKGFKTVEDEKKFIEDFQETFSGDKRHKALLLPHGIDTGDPIRIDNDKAQFLQTRQLQRTVIAGAFGISPYHVGDLTSGKYSNVEQQSEDFTLNVIMPISQAFESAMERDLLTVSDRNSGIKIRFNLDIELRAAFIDRQNGLQIQLQNGVITPNDWREIEGRTPRPDAGGDEFQQSVQTQNGVKPNDPNTTNNPPAN
jgi:HK97 family phage portal protein